MNAHEKLVWTQEMSIGNSKVDKDHQKLVNIYNDLLDLTNKGYSSNEFSRILSDMTDYTMFHFKKEETYMVSFSYPEFKNHRNEHVQMIYQVAMYNYELHNNGVDPYEILGFLKSWWTNHIKIHDGAYERFRTENHAEAEYR